MICFSIMDKKVGQFMTPFFCPNVVTAMRSVQSALREKSNLSQYSHDFSLYEIGHFNADEGLLVSKGVPVLVEEIANLMEVKHV